MSIKTLIKNMINVNEAAHKAKEKVRVQIGDFASELRGAALAFSWNRPFVPNKRAKVRFCEKNTTCGYRIFLEPAVCSKQMGKIEVCRDINESVIKEVHDERK